MTKDIKLLRQGAFSHVLNGKTVDGKGAKMLDVVDPATEKPIAQVPIATRQDVDTAVEHARNAFAGWAAKSWDERAACIEKWGADYKAMDEDLAQLLTAEQGKSLTFAKNEVDTFKEWFDIQPKMRLEEKVMHEDDQSRVITRHVPLGVAVGIVPWNFPILLMMWKILPAVLAGNCIIIKPSPFTPLCAVRLIESAQKHFPPGVIQLILGDDHLGPWLTEHPGIQKVSFTGSTQTGKLVARSCSATLKRFTLELGGNDPSIILPDVDIDQAAPTVLLGAFANTGQICVASKRIYVHEDIYDKFSAKLKEVVQGMKVGPGAEEGTLLGPINNKMQYEKVGEFFADSKKQGHKFLFGGEPQKSGNGYFYPLTAVDNPPDDSRLVTQEPFGPIVPLLKWKDEKDLLRRVNDTQWGLGANIWGKDQATLDRIARQIESGTIWINRILSFHPHVTFAGHKSSGIGSENGFEGLAGWTSPQSIWFPKST